MELVFFYAKDGQKIGPLTREQLDDLRLAPDTLVWHYGLRDWIPYRNLPKQKVKRDGSSPLDSFLKLFKSKKKESAPKAEVQPTTVIETTKEEPADTKESEVTAEQDTKPVVDPETIAQKKREREAHSAKVYKGLKKFAIGLLILIATGGVVTGGCYAYNYYQNTYLPKKYADEACAELENKWANANHSDKLAMALQILTKDTKWGYKNVPDTKINQRFAAPKRKKALKLYEDDAYNGDATSQFQMGQFYGITNKYHVTIDYTKAAYWWREAALNGNSNGYVNLGWAYETGNGVPENMQKAIECYRSGADMDNPMCLYHLGLLYETGVTEESGYHYEQYKSFDHGPEYSDDIFVRSGWQGFDHYEVYKHKVTDYKTILPQDMNMARTYWQRAAALGNEDAKEKLQRVFE